MNLEARTAIEALRAGVPNGAAVRLLGTEEAGIEQTFDDLLAACWSEEPRAGIGIAGGFGTGKSHFLGYLAEVARTHDFVVSRVVISKETPLSDAGRVFEAAMRGAVLPNRNDDAIGAAVAIVRDSPERLDALEAAITQPGAGLAPVFAAILYLLRKAATPVELIRRFERFLSGGRLTSAALRQALAAAGAPRRFDLRFPPAAALSDQRVRFAARLFQAAGFAGWCMLLDEVELIGRYTALQRATAYARLSVWLGLDPRQRYPGLVTVYAITDDFVTAVIEQRQDQDRLTERLRLKGRPADATLAETAIRHIEDAVRRHRLRSPGAEELQRTCARLRDIYRDAYAWPAPALPLPERTATGTMRHYIKAWITRWDLDRLTGTDVAIVADMLHSSYEVDEGLAETSPDEPGDDWG